MNLENVPVCVSRESTEDGFELWGVYYNALPVVDELFKAAQLLNPKISDVLSKRFRIFGRLMDLIVRQENLGPWKQVDLALTALALNLEEEGVNGALEAVQYQTEDTECVAGGVGIGHKEGL